jgi:putative FmdB family regulatory protein
MPTYVYKCKECGKGPVEVTKSMADSDRIEHCPECHRELTRSYAAEHSGNVDGREYATPLASDSLAMHPEQIPEHRKRFPNIDIMPDGRPVFHNVREHSRYLKAIGWDKMPQRRR